MLSFTEGGGLELDPGEETTFFIEIMIYNIFRRGLLLVGNLVIFVTTVLDKNKACE